jgi:glycosyltransferase involved in cell wall biosynthesis
MRIVLLVPAPFDTISGGYVYDRRIVAGLRALGNDVTVVELAGRHPLPDDAALQDARTAWAAVPADAAIVIDGLALPAFAGFAETFAARGVVGLIHHPTGLETGLDSATSTALLDIERRMFPLLSRAIVTSRFTGEGLSADFGVDPDRITVVVPGTEDAPRSLGGSDGVCRIFALGTLIPRKGHDVLLRALARLFDLDWHLTIAGNPHADPACAAMLYALPQELGIAERVTFLGELSGQPLADLWSRSDIFALATHFEGYGMAIAEALKRGLPVCVTKGGAAGDLVSPEAGTVSPVDNVEQLSRSLRRVIFDTALRHDFAEAAWAIGQTLPDWAAQADAFARALEDACANPASPI